MQGYDSVAVKSDVEVAAPISFLVFSPVARSRNDTSKSRRTFSQQNVVGTDGRKMSTSWGNVINIVDGPDDQFGKVMSMRDDQIPNYFHLATDVP